jgi:hypothetical protein
VLLQEPLRAKRSGAPGKAGHAAAGMRPRAAQEQAFVTRASTDAGSVPFASSGLVGIGPLHSLIRSSFETIAGFCCRVNCFSTGKAEVLPLLWRAVRHRGWIGAHRSVSETEALIAQLSELRRRSALADTPFHIGLTGHELVDADHAALTRLGVDSVTLPIAALGRTRSLEERLAAIRRLAEHLGV